MKYFAIHHDKDLPDVAFRHIFMALMKNNILLCKFI